MLSVGWWGTEVTDARALGVSRGRVLWCWSIGAL